MPSLLKIDDADRQLVPADRLHFHAGETEGAVAFDREHGLAGLHRGRDGIAHADAHDAPGADVQALARLIHVDDAAREIERVGTFVDQDGIRPLHDDGAQGAERAVEVHRRVEFFISRGAILAMFSSRFDVTALIQSAGGAGQLPPMPSRRAETQEPMSPTTGATISSVAVHLLGLDVDLDEPLRSRLAPGLALAVRQQPVEAGADQHHDVGVLQHRRARRARALRMRVGQKALGHAHRQERNAALLDQRADRVIGLRVGRALAEDDQGALGALQHIERALDRIGRGNLGRRRIDDLDERLPSGLRVHDLTKQLGRQIEIDAARAPGHRSADRAGEADADVGGMQHAEGRLAERLGDGELVHLFVVALLQVDDLAL